MTECVLGSKPGQRIEATEATPPRRRAEGRMNKARGAPRQRAPGRVDAHGCALPDGTEVIASVAAQLALTEHLAPTLATVMRDRRQLRYPTSRAGKPTFPSTTQATPAPTSS